MYELPILPLIFDTTPGLGATKPRATRQYPFLHLRERFGTLAAVVTFSPFWAGKSPRHAKIACFYLFTVATASPRQSKPKEQNYEREGSES